MWESVRTKDDAVGAAGVVVGGELGDVLALLAVHGCGVGLAAYGGGLAAARGARSGG